MFKFPSPISQSRKRSLIRQKEKKNQRASLKCILFSPHNFAIKTPTPSAPRIDIHPGRNTKLAHMCEYFKLAASPGVKDSSSPEILHRDCSTERRGSTSVCFPAFALCVCCVYTSKHNVPIASVIAKA